MTHPNAHQEVMRNNGIKVVKNKTATHPMWGVSVFGVVNCWYGDKQNAIETRDKFREDYIAEYHRTLTTIKAQIQMLRGPVVVAEQAKTLVDAQAAITVLSEALDEILEECE